MINVLPEQEKSGLLREYRLRLATVCLCMTTLLAVLACILLLPSYVMSTSKESILESRLVQMNELNPSVSLSDLNIFIDKINNTLSLFDNKSIVRDTYKSVFLPLLESRPNDIQISQFLYSDKGEVDGVDLEIHGVAVNRGALQSFKTILENSGNFIKVDVPISNFVKRTNIDFTMSLYIK